MNPRSIVLFLAIILAVVGAYLSGMLLSQHIPNAAAPDWFKSVCSSQSNPAFDCSSVLNSRWAYFPPKNEDGTPTPWSRPAALWGLWYFTFMAVWYLFIGRVNPAQRTWHLVPLVCNLAGLLGAAYFVWVMMTRMDSKCIWCLVTHTMNLMLMVCTVILWPRKPAHGAVAGEQLTDPRPDGRGPHQIHAAPYPASTAHPGLRLTLATLSIAAVVMFCEMLVANAYAMNSQLTEYKKYHESLKKDIGFLYTTYQNQEKREIPIRPDDPVRGDGPDLIETVVFSDFTCPMCRTFARTLDEELNKLFEGKLKIVFKHFPACVDCNPLVPRTIPGHEAACIAAQAAEAARMQGGSTAFWKAHDWFFANARTIKNTDWKAFAAEMGLDFERFESDRNSESTKERIVEDIELAKSIGVTGTPSLFLSGRYVPPLVRESGVFWKEMKQTYDRNMKKRNAAKPSSAGSAAPLQLESDSNTKPQGG